MSLKLTKNNQSFIIFDIAMVFLVVFGLWVGYIGLSLQGLWKIVGAIFILGVFTVIYGVFIEPRRIKVVSYKRDLVKTPKARIKVVFIADLHADFNKSNKWYGKVINKIKDLNADLLLVGGDMVVADIKNIKKLEPLKDLDLDYGKFFILGNHDYLDDPKTIKDEFKSWGFVDVTNSYITLRCQGLELRLAGTDDCFFGKKQVLISPSSNSPFILLSHEPDVVLDMAEGQADLVLCGHNHGGQIRLPIIGSLFVPSKLGRKVDFGLKIINGIPIILTTGLGEVLCRARLFCPPEIVVLEIGI